MRRSQISPSLQDRLLKKAASRIEGLLLSVFDEGSCYQANDAGRTLHLRPSSFPFCPLRFFLTLPESLSKGRRIPASMAYYVRVGQTIHDVFQEAIATHDTANQFFIRDWKCDKCHHLHRLTTLPPHCVKCNAPFRIHEHPANLEHTIKEGNLVGHVDDSFTFSHNDNDYLIVIDYKSTSLSRLNSNKLPESSHLHQLRAYASLLNKKHHVLGYVLIYIPRDNPRKLKAFPFMLTDKEATSTLRTIARYETQHRQALNASTRSEVLQLIDSRPCHDEASFNEFTSHCAFKAFCTTSNSPQLVQLADERLQRRLAIANKTNPK